MTWNARHWLLVCLVTWAVTSRARSDDSTRLRDLWPEHAPGETTADRGTPLPQRANEKPPATRLAGITCPQLERFDPPTDRRNGTAILVFPGGGYNYVVSDKEGSEVAQWLNGLGITAWVVRYRTKPAVSTDEPLWRRPLQDGQRAVRTVRHHAAQWGLRADRVGVLGFSAGGLTAAVVAARFHQPAYEPQDAIDQQSCRPDFAMLVYPWKLVDESTGQLADYLPVSKEHPPTLLIHAHDDGVTSLSSAMLYAALKQHRVPAELHIYQSGGHGFGMRAAADSPAAAWPAQAAGWLQQQHWLDVATAP
ncbi:MAG: alpha/beta hydrolase [Pirellulaceae bacterium]